MDPLASLSTSLLASKAAGNLLGGLVSSIAPAASAFQDTLSSLWESDGSAEVLSESDGPVGNEPGSGRDAKNSDSFQSLAERLQYRIQQLLSEAGLPQDLSFDLELTPLGGVYVSPDGPGQTSVSTDQQLTIESVLEGDGEFLEALKDWSSRQLGGRFRYSGSQ